MFWKKKNVPNTPMSSAPFVYNDDGSIAWDLMWDSFCYLAIEGGNPHRETMLYGKGKENDLNNDNYKKAIKEILRAYSLLVPYKAQDNGNGYIKVKMPSPMQAKWFQAIINSENVECKRESRFLFLPVNDDFQIEKEVKNIVTVMAKAYHYWAFHKNIFQQIWIIISGKNI